MKKILFLIFALAWMCGAGWAATSAETKLLCHFNGSNGATSYTSDDANARVATFYSSAQLSTVQKKFGTASLLLTAETSDYISFPDSDDWAFGTSDFTIDAWVYIASLWDGESTTLVSQVIDSDNWWALYVYKYGASTWFYIRGYSGGVSIIDWSPSATISTGAFFHWALVRSGNTLYMFQNGTLLDTFDATGVNFPNFASPLYIGIGAWGGPWGPLDGYIDELRITNTAEWTDDFTSPTSEYSFATTSPYSHAFNSGFNEGFNGGQN